MIDVQELLQGNDSIIYMGSQLIISCSGIPDAQTLFKKKKKKNNNLFSNFPVTIDIDSGMYPSQENDPWSTV